MTSIPEEHGPPLPIRPGLMTKRRSSEPSRRASADICDSRPGAADTMRGFQLPAVQPSTLGPLRAQVRITKAKKISVRSEFKWE